MLTPGQTLTHGYKKGHPSSGTTLASAAPAMKIIALILLAVGVIGDKAPLYSPPVPIVRSNQVNPDSSGAHSSDFEAGNGIVFQLSGSEGVAGGSNLAGTWRYPLEDGSIASFKFVADENGYQPESSLLPVAPAFPHPIPQFVLDQIEFARLEDERYA
ncbi:cuticle protein AMP4-like [Penaeus japonicus]|uniref:cuticle protein AMP4-like n=1 Tax=Penaeus japonicus TaxID=27405 RepID=UPI001C713EC7|nr:cuticle protein AMP4-like [Penaeus japonicus]